MDLSSENLMTSELISMVDIIFEVEGGHIKLCRKNEIAILQDDELKQQLNDKGWTLVVSVGILGVTPLGDNFILS